MTSPTATATPKRRRSASGMSGQQSAILGGRIDVLEEKVSHVDKKVGELSGKVNELDEKIDGLREDMASLKSERHADGRWLRQEMTALREQIGAMQAVPVAVDAIKGWREKAVNVMLISICVLVTLAVLGFLDRSLLAPQASKEAHEIFKP